MGLIKSLKNLVSAFGGSSSAKTMSGILDELALAINPLAALKVDVDIDEDEDLLGKTVGDLQSDIKIGQSVISGKLKYVTGYTGFSGDAEEQEGNYLALHASVPNETGVTITVTTPGGTTTLDADGIHIMIIKSEITPDKTLTFTASKEGCKSVSRTYTLMGIALEPAPEGVG